MATQQLKPYYPENQKFGLLNIIWVLSHFTMILLILAGIIILFII